MQFQPDPLPLFSSLDQPMIFLRNILWLTQLQPVPSLFNYTRNISFNEPRWAMCPPAARCQQQSKSWAMSAGTWGTVLNAGERNVASYDYGRFEEQKLYARAAPEKVNDPIRTWPKEVTADDLEQQFNCALSSMRKIVEEVIENSSMLQPSVRRV